MDTPTTTLFLYRVTDAGESVALAAGVMRLASTGMSEVLDQLSARFPLAEKIEIRKIAAAAAIA